MRAIANRVGAVAAVCAASAAGAAVFAVFAAGSSAAPGAFPGKNGALVFDAVVAKTSSVQIFEVSASGTGLKQLTSTTGAVWNEDPTFSSTGRIIYFDRFDRSTTRPSHIYRMNADGTGVVLSDQPSAPTHVWPSVNRRGLRLAVVQYGKSGRAVIAKMKRDGSDRRVVAQAASLQGNGGPAFAPEGPNIAFYRVTYHKSGQGIARSDLFVRKNGRNMNITAHRSAKFFGPSWAPSGRTLIAIRGQRTIVSMRPNGTGMRVLTTVSGAHTAISDVVYSPDGKKIAYLQCTGDCGDPNLQGQGSIWVMNANGKGKHRVFNGANGVQPANRLSWGVS